VKIQDAKSRQKIRHLSTIAQLCRDISSQLRHMSTIGKICLNSNISSTSPHNMANFGPLAAEISSGVRGTPANFNGFRVFAALLQDTLVVGVSKTLRRWTEGATYIRQGVYHVRHWPIFCTVCHNYRNPNFQGPNIVNMRFICRKISGPMYEIMLREVLPDCPPYIMSLSTWTWPACYWYGSQTVAVAHPSARVSRR